MAERRRHKRRHLVYRLKVVDRGTQRILGYLVDVTTEGLMLMSEDPIELGRTFELRMALPAAVEGSRPIYLEAKSIWSRSEPGVGYHDTGFEMVRIDPADMDEIQHLIEGHAFRN